MFSTRIALNGSIFRPSSVRSLYTAINKGSLLRPSVAAYRNASNQESKESDHSIPDTHFVSPLDRITLILTRTMKAEDITAEVNAGTMDKANNRRRIIINSILVVATVVSGLWIIKKSQKQREEHTLVSLHERNVQRYKKLKEEEEVAAAATANPGTTK